MTSREFCYWLQGFFEIAEAGANSVPLSSRKLELNEAQADTIRRHLDLVFFHEIDQSYTNDVKKQTAMNNIHGLSDGGLVRC